eukprot:923196_1
MMESTEAHAEETRTWEPKIAEQIIKLLEERRKVSENDAPLLVGVVGIPGCGKSTSSGILSSILTANEINNIIMPMDGYHYSLAQLQKFNNPEEAVYRRGAPDTFDSGGLENDLRKIRDGKEEVVHMPGFDHAKGDPEPKKFLFERHKHSVVICEGLYLLHRSDGWERIAELLDHVIFIDADVDKCVERLKIRNLCIPGYTKEEILIRCDKVDRTNAMIVLKTKNKAGICVQSTVM